jgi:hypothetical protein
MAQDAGGSVVELLDGHQLDGPVRLIEESRLTLEDGRSLPLDNIRRVQHPMPSVANPARVRLYLDDGSMMIIDDIRISGEKAHITWAHGTLEIPLERLKAVLLVPLSADDDGRARPEPAFTQALDQPNAQYDRLLAIGEEQLTVVEGALESIDAERLVFHWQGESRTVRRERVYGLVMADDVPRAQHNSHCEVYLVDGSRILGKAIALANGVLQLQRSRQTLAFNWSSVQRIEFYHPRLVFLSELDPLKVESEAMFTLAGWERDQNFMRRPLTLNGVEYERGIGMHAPCAVTWQLDGRYETFAAVIGIDDDTFGRGDCIFRVVADGRTLLEQRQRGEDSPRRIILPISGVSELTLISDIGEGLDLADHANWADARLILPASP